MAQCVLSTSVLPSVAAFHKPTLGRQRVQPVLALRGTIVGPATRSCCLYCSYRFAERRCDSPAGAPPTPCVPPCPGSAWSGTGTTCHGSPWGSPSSAGPRPCPSCLGNKGQPFIYLQILVWMVRSFRHTCAVQQACVRMTMKWYAGPGPGPSCLSNKGHGVSVLRKYWCGWSDCCHTCMYGVVQHACVKMTTTWYAGPGPCPSCL